MTLYDLERLKRTLAEKIDHVLEVLRTETIHTTPNLSRSFLSCLDERRYTGTFSMNAGTQKTADGGYIRRRTVKPLL